MANTTHSYSDQPARTTHDDQLNFTPSATALSAIINNPATETPLTIGVYGPWGSGKTSLMQMIVGQLDPDQRVYVWFDAWRYAQADALWRALLIAVVEGLRTAFLREDNDTLLRKLVRHHNLVHADGAQLATDADGLAAERARRSAQLDALIDQLYRSVEREELGGIEIDWGAAGKLAARTAVRLSLSAIPLLGTLTRAVESAQEQLGTGEDATQLFEVFQRERARIYRAQVQSLEQFHSGLQALITAWLVDLNLRLVVCIDDLDRCLPEQAVGVLEAIKVFLDIEGCIFVLGMDRQIIEHGIRLRYQAHAPGSAAPLPIGERDYLAKIVQVPFELPPLEHDDIQQFLQRRLAALLQGADAAAAGPVATILTAGLAPNPRTVKRAVNAFALLRALLAAHGQAAPLELLAKLVVIQSSFSAAYEQIVARPTALHDLESAARQLPGRSVPQEASALVQANARLKEMLHNQPFFERLSETELRRLIFHTGRMREGA